MMEEERGFRIYYCDFVHDSAISSSKPEFLAADRLVPLAEHLLAAQDNYLGVLDANDNILQFYMSGKEMVVELLYPDAQGMMQCKLPLEKGMQLLASLPDEFSEQLLPGAAYIG
ncbi:hypothetical protein [Thiolapillus sp.]